MSTTALQHQMHMRRRLGPARSICLALVALTICVAVPTLAALEAWEIDAAWRIIAGREPVP
jgi:hypothetical protein